MKKLFLLAIAFVGAPTLPGAVVVHVPPEPLRTLPDASYSYAFYDINSDGTDDFAMGGIGRVGTNLATLQTNRYLAIPAIYPNSGGCPAALGEGAILGLTALPTLIWLNSDSVDGFVLPSEVGMRNTTLTRCLDTGCVGTFYPGFSAFRALLGFEFEAADGRHYGYFDLTFPPLSWGGYINGWAYESEPDAPIATAFIPVPEPSSLAMLFLGALPWLARRHRR